MYYVLCIMLYVLCIMYCVYYSKYQVDSWNVAICITSYMSNVIMQKRIFIIYIYFRLRDLCKDAHLHITRHYPWALFSESLHRLLGMYSKHKTIKVTFTLN